MKLSTEKPVNRIHYSQHVIIDTNGHVSQGTFQQIGLDGALIVTGTDISIGDTLTLSFSLPDVKHDFNMPAIARWKSNEGHLGVQFTSAKAIEVWAISKLLKGHCTSRRTSTSTQTRRNNKSADNGYDIAL